MADINRSSIYGQTYQNPPQYLPQTPMAPQQPYQDEVGPVEENLQQVDGLTSDYFDKWAALKSFARDAQENLGVDVRFPNPDVPESNRLHRIYLKSLADLKKQANLLKTSQSMYNSSLQRGDIINMDPNKQAFATMQPGQDVVSHVLDPIVTEANNKLQQQYYGNTVKEAKAYYDDVKARLQQKAVDNPDQAEYWKRQVDALTPPTRAEKEFDPYHRTSAGDKAKLDSSEAFLRKQANLANGTSDSYKLSDTVFGPQGERMYVSKDQAGDTYAGKTVVQREYSPTTGEVNLVLKDKDGTVSRIPATDVMSLAKGFITENPRYSSAGEYFDSYAKQAGLLTSTGDLNSQPLITPDAPQRQQAMQQEVGKLDAMKTSSQLAQLKDKVSKMESHWYRDDRQSFVGSSGVPIRVRAKDDDGKKVFEIENAKVVFPQATPAQLKAYKNLGQQALINLLSKQGAHLSEEVETPAAGTTSAPTKGKTISNATLQGLLNKPGYEGQTIEDLVKYYQDNGYTVK
jgi:hypothetical protein